VPVELEGLLTTVSKSQNTEAIGGCRTEVTSASRFVHHRITNEKKHVANQRHT
jgi:hypothetical protein